MADFIERVISKTLIDDLQNFPAVAILGPRQCGKSTLARVLIQQFPGSIWLDLENPEDRAKLTDPLLFFRSFAGRLICIDEVQLAPDIFGVLRTVIDENGSNGQFLFLGSASRDLLRQTSESLAGRIVYESLTPFLWQEIGSQTADPFVYLRRGGFPRSFLAGTDEASYKWRQSFISTFLERDLSMLGFGFPPDTMRRLWMILAHNQGQIVNLARFGNSLGISHTMARQYLDLLTATFMVRLLQPFETNVEKRVVKSPRSYVRDTGLLLALLGINDQFALLGHPVLGAAWETFVIENAIATAQPDRAGFYRTSNGAEIDLVMEKNGKKIAIECKASSSPSVSKGLFSALLDLGIEKAYVAAPVRTSWPLHPMVDVVTPSDLFNLLSRW